jgi:transcriptional regulator with XRE-family HTH domain
MRLSQAQLAKKLRVKQPEVAKIEKRADMLVSTLAGVLRAMGAELKIVAKFPDHEIQIRSLGKLSGKISRASVAHRNRPKREASRRVAAGG